MGRRVEALKKREDAIVEWLIDRAWRKYGPDEDHRGWENKVLHHWPSLLTINYWDYLLSDLRKGHWGGWEAPRWINLPSPITDIEEWRWFLKNFRFAQLFEETKIERLICRWRGHPKGEVYYNPGGDEPDHHCKTCGENIG